MLMISHREGSFSDRWIEYCRDHGVAYRLADLFSGSLVAEIKASRASGFLCHPKLMDRRSQIAAKQIVKSLDQAGVSVFPAPQDYWHYDDKIAQKYLFEALDIPTPQTHVFFEKRTAIDWLRGSTFPLVFKLRCGAGSSNVRLIRTLDDAIVLTKQMFGAGYRTGNTPFTDLGAKVHKHRLRRDWFATAKRLPATLRKNAVINSTIPRERGYIYLQEFVPGNECDIRITVIGDRAFGFRRMVRPGDFRASGSGRIDYEPKLIDRRCIDLAFYCSSRLGSACMAYDFVLDSDKAPRMVEMSYAFDPEAVRMCPGHWDRAHCWRTGEVFPQDAILIDFLKRTRVYPGADSRDG
jgi:hypothetical protein